jgi:hypothetical protein
MMILGILSEGLFVHSAATLQRLCFTGLEKAIMPPATGGIGD